MLSCASGVRAGSLACCKHRAGAAAAYEAPTLKRETGNKTVAHTTVRTYASRPAPTTSNTASQRRHTSCLKAASCSQPTLPRSRPAAHILLQPLISSSQAHAMHRKKR
jgi:hypothetical protein